MFAYLNQPSPGTQKPIEPDPTMDDGMAAIGKPIPFFRKNNAYKQCKLMGMKDEHCYPCVNSVSEQLERDEPFKAMEVGMQYLDLTGVYRLFAYLLTGSEVKES